MSSSAGATIDFLCGALAGAAADTCLYPMDTMRARLMVRRVPRGLVREGVALVRAEGAQALYKGLGAHLLVAMPGNGLFYLAYEAARSQAIAHMPSGAAASVAAVAGCLASLLLYTPMEVVKQRAMVTRGAGSASVFNAVLRKDGLPGLYRGLGAGALTWAPYFSLYFAAYELLTTNVCGVPAGEQPPLPVALGSGLIAGIGAAALTNPCDVVKTRLQVGTATGSSFSAARQIITSEGAGALVRGIVPRVLLLAPLSSLTISFYSLFRRVADDVMRETPVAKKRIDQ